MFKIGVLSSCRKHRLLISFSIPSISFRSLCFSCCLNSQVAKFLSVFWEISCSIYNYHDDQENLNVFFKELEIRRRNQRFVELSNCDTIARIWELYTLCLWFCLLMILLAHSNLSSSIIACSHILLVCVGIIVQLHKGNSLLVCKFMMRCNNNCVV